MHFVREIISSEARADVVEESFVISAGAEVEGFLCISVEQRDDDAVFLRVLVVLGDIGDETWQDGGGDEVAEGLPIGLEDKVRVRHAFVEMRPYAKV